MDYQEENQNTMETRVSSQGSVLHLPGTVVAGIIIVSFLAGLSGGVFGSRYIEKGNGTLSGSGTANQRVVLAEDSAIIDVVKKASPAVVSIVVSKDLSRVPGFGGSFFGIDPFAPFFGGVTEESNEPNIQQVGAGSGFFVSSDGMILTNRHVVNDPNASYTVLTNDGKKYEAQVLARDSVNDLAILKIGIVGAPTVELADSSKIEIGQRVIAIGNSLGQYQNTVTTGVVSGIGRSIVAGGVGVGAEQLEGVIQTDAAINPGNSGGPLLNTIGQVIGINTAVDREGQSVGFAIPSSDAKRALDSFKKNGRITRPYIGVRYVMITKALADSEKLPRDFGALIARGRTANDHAVLPGSPADKAGLAENDILLECNGQKLQENFTLSACIKDKEVGDTVVLKVYHDGTEKNVTVKLEERK